MSMNEYKEELKKIIDATDDEALLKRWKAQLQSDSEIYRKQQTTEANQTSSEAFSADENAGKEDTSGYVVLESGLGIDE